MRLLGCSLADIFSLKCAGSFDSRSSQHSNSVSFSDISLNPEYDVLPRDDTPPRVKGLIMILVLLSFSCMLPPRVAGLLFSELALRSEGSVWTVLMDFEVAVLVFNGGVPMRNSAQSARMILDENDFALGVVNGLDFALPCFARANWSFSDSSLKTNELTGGSGIVLLHLD